ncbi:hypothetical protein BJ878DRAFT_451042 [Calycina marina]|uniref:Integral membrane protein TmpA n=1 Tax=Calycina marina TaxID=1763456 RepID=A0A9P7ZBJ8_9HELO|nr:hypothetical protein BJ878DRAFT_451042 [Calycina marina]
MIQAFYPPVAVPPFQPAHAVDPRTEKDIDIERLNSPVDNRELPGSSLPGLKYNQPLAIIRHIWLNVYHRLFILVFAANMIGLGFLIAVTPSWTENPPLDTLATAAAGNILVAILIRQDYIINGLFKLTWFVPITAPLRLRRILAKVYEFGGVHSGAACSSVIWYLLFTIFLTQQFAVGRIKELGFVMFTCCLAGVLLLIITTAMPGFRSKNHNTFEHIHRWCGWAALLLFWIDLSLYSYVMTLIASKPFYEVFFLLPAFWLLLIATIHAIMPWVRLHKLEVKAERLGNYAMRLHFKEPIPCFVGLRIAQTPLGEWHSFACVPSRDSGRSGGYIIMSGVGDWTKRNIAIPQPYYWVKGRPVTGVLCMAKIFRSVIIVTTGSGIGPCLGVMQDIPRTTCRVIWSTPDPLNTYGQDIMGAVLATDARAVIYDTTAHKDDKGKTIRPDLPKMAWELYVQEKAEAVFVISNPAVTKAIVFAMESRGIPAFGPIWDS